LFHVLLAFAVQRGVGKFFQQSVSFAIEYAISLLDNSVADGLCDMTLATARRTQKQ
jgi:hypothetical protein